MKSASFALALCGLLAATGISAAQEAKPLKVMLITGGCCHDYKKQTEILKKGLEERINVTVDQIHVDDKVRDYIVHVVFATRQPEKYKLDVKNFIQFGASPRATIYLTLAAKAWALLQGRAYVTPEDVKSIGPDVLRHRIILTYEAEAQAVTTDAIIKKVFNAVPVP